MERVKASVIYIFIYIYIYIEREREREREITKHISMLLWCSFFRAAIFVRK